MTIGEMEDSRARCRYVKHSMSSMWTSSTKSTPGTNSAMPWSMYLFTTLFISPRSLSENKKRLVIVLLENYRSVWKTKSKQNFLWIFHGLVFYHHRGKSFVILKLGGIWYCTGETSVQQNISKLLALHWGSLCPLTWLKKKSDFWVFRELGRGEEVVSQTSA